MGAAKVQFDSPEAAQRSFLLQGEALGAGVLQVKAADEPLPPVPATGGLKRGREEVKPPLGRPESVYKKAV